MKKKYFLFTSLWGLFCISVNAETVVYTSHKYPVNHTDNISVVYIDAHEQYQDKVFNGLSSDPTIAEKQVKEIFKSSDWKSHEQQVIELSRGMIKAWELKLQKIPAIVFDDKFVVYGSTDIKYAEIQLRRHLNEKE